MFWIDKKSYVRTLSVVLGKTVLPPMFIELKQFIEKEFGFTIYDITFDKYSNSNKLHKKSLAYGKKYKLIFQVASIQERESMQNKIYVETISKYAAFKMEFDKQKQNSILSKFFDLAKKYSFETAAKENEIWIDYFYWFPFDYMSYLVNSIIKKTSEMIKKEYKGYRKYMADNSKRICCNSIL